MIDYGILLFFFIFAVPRGVDLGMEENGDKYFYTEPNTYLLVLKNAFDNALSYTPSLGQVTVRSSVIPTMP